MNRLTAIRHYLNRRKASWLPAVCQLAVLIVVACLLLWPAPVTRNQLFAAWPTSDLMLSHWPTALLIQRTFAQSHTLPLWNPYFGGGQPLGADPLAALFYPPTQLVHFFSLRDYYLILILGHLVWAGLGVLLLARHALGLPRLPALVAAISYMATPTLLAHLGAGHVTMVQSVAWYPWLALTCWATVRVSLRWGALLGLCIALMLLAGHPQLAYYGLVMTAILAAWLLMQRWRLDGWRALLESIAGLTLAGIIGTLLAAIYLLPLMEFTALSTRQSPVIITDTYPLQNFIHALVFQPSSNGLKWEDTIAPGLVVLVLAVIGLVSRLRRVWPLLLGIVLVAALAIGYASPLYPFVARFLPDLNRFRGTDRIWFVALMLIALLASYGTDALMRGVRHLFQRREGRTWKVGGGVIGSLAALLVACSLIVSDYGYARVGDISAITTPTALATAATRLAGNGRVYGAQENILQLYAVELQVPFADGLNPLMIESYVNYMLRADGLSAGGYYLHIPVGSPSSRPNAKLLGLMNTSAVVSRTHLSDPAFVQVGVVNGIIIYRNAADAGPGYLIEPGPGGNPPTINDAQRLNESVHVITLSPEQQTYTFTTRTAAYFVIAMPSFPGWTAVVDGHAATIQQFAGALPAIKVGPGTHNLNYTYAPASVRIGALLSLVGLLSTLLWLVLGWLWKPGGQRPRGEDEDRAEERPQRLSPAEMSRGNSMSSIEL